MSASEDDLEPVGTTVFELREEAQVDAYETIPIPRKRAQNAQAFKVITDDVTAWPGQRLTWRFEYNQFANRWVFDCHHPDYGRLFDGRSWATLGRAYNEYPYMMAHFIVSGGGVDPPEHVTPANLGRTVKLAVAPGPAGGSFPDAAGLTPSEEYALLGRYASEYPITGAWI